MNQLSWCVYILQCGDGSLYTGITNRLQVRLASHKLGQGAKYTRSHLPVKLVYVEPQLSRSSSLQREAMIKKLPRLEKLKLVAKDFGLGSEFFGLIN